MVKKYPGYDTELLSVYLDGALSAGECASLEKRLAVDEGLRIELEGLSATRNILRSLPARKIPRSFVLTPAMVSSPPSIFSRLFPVMRAASVLATILFILTFAGQFLPGRMLSAAPETQYTFQPSTEDRLTTEVPPIILWASPDNSTVSGNNFPSNTYGIGGGSGVSESGPAAVLQPFPPNISPPPAGELAVGKSVAPSSAAPEAAPPAAAAEKILPTLSAPAEGITAAVEPTTGLEDLPVSTQLPPTSALRAEPTRQSSDLVTEPAAAPGAGMILGLPSQEEEGKIQSSPFPAADASPVLSTGNDTLPAVQVFLAGTAILTAFLSLIFWQKTKF